MKMIPLFRVTDMKAAVHFYTGVLDFVVANPASSDEDWVVLLQNDDAYLMLTQLELDQKIAIAANVLVTNIDHRFEKYRTRGLDQRHKKDSPVHQGPVDQTWGTREFYVTDVDGNTLRFLQW